MTDEHDPAPDPRPKPRYGEYAPEGWTWQPPQGEPAAEPEPPASNAATTSGADAGKAAAPASAPEAKRPASDRFLTIMLLVLGAFGAWSMAAGLQDLPRQLVLAYRQQDIGEYTPGANVPTITFIGTVVLLALYAAVLGWSILRLRAGRLSFWIPLAGGAAAILVMFAIIFAIVIGDPTFLEYVRRMSAG
ncbi:DUF6264 family protein [Agromyces archimandritae]|uniref:Uncharacterized protein n=1 Tax=Agromyces archimandritae TaxID=2781962 RepID=A0A975FLL4_9MICO|nr:DUF6264 family protein [Agromyces archimandritae]QTX04184.1 hypothetical protein G127AT_12950 [Agromyces archimandritae]